MTAIKLIVRKYAVLLFLSFCTVGCEKWSLKGEYKEFGTATVNNREYVDMRWRGWNSEFIWPVVAFYPQYNMFEFGLITLQPKELGKVINPEYRIEFCLTTENGQIQTGLPYKIEYNKSLEEENPKYITKETKRTLILDKSTLISSDSNNGIAIVFDLKTKTVHSMEGYIIIDSLDFKNDFCSGKYMLKTPEISDKEQLLIEGRFDKSYAFEPNGSPI